MPEKGLSQRPFGRRPSILECICTIADQCIDAIYTHLFERLEVRSRTENGIIVERPITRVKNSGCARLNVERAHFDGAVGQWYSAHVKRADFNGLR